VFIYFQNAANFPRPHGVDRAIVKTGARRGAAPSARTPRKFPIVPQRRSLTRHQARPMEEVHRFTGSRQSSSSGTGTLQSDQQPKRATEQSPRRQGEGFVESERSAAELRLREEEQFGNERNQWNTKRNRPPGPRSVGFVTNFRRNDVCAVAVLQSQSGKTASVSAVPRTKVKVSGGTQTCSSDLQQSHSEFCDGFVSGSSLRLSFRIKRSTVQELFSDRQCGEPAQPVGEGKVDDGVTKSSKGCRPRLRTSLEAGQA
jgi:hypothetical protein